MADSFVTKALPELFSESVEAKIYSVAARDYSSHDQQGTFTSIARSIHDLLHPSASPLKGPPESYPEYVEPGGSVSHPYTYTQSRFWTSGFFPGSIWLLYERAKTYGVTSGNIELEELLNLAKSWTEPIAQQAGRDNTHDVGFLFMPTFYKWYKLEKSEEAKQTMLKAARGLATRYHPWIGCTKSWDTSGHLLHGFPKEESHRHFLVIIDNMMNLDLLYSAHHLSPSSITPNLSEMATQHAITTIRNQFHPDGGTWHVIDYSQPTSPDAPAKVLKRWAAQGYSDDSTWSRGQAWALHGYAKCAEWTDTLVREAKAKGSAKSDGSGNLEAADGKFEGRMDFVEQSKIASDYFVARLGEGKEAVPPWDFDCPRPADGSLTFRDVSAGMIAASGMLTLHTILRRIDSPTVPSPYLSHALKIVRATLKYCSTPAAHFIPSNTASGQKIDLHSYTAGRRINLGEGGWDTILNQSTINYNEHARRRWADVGLVYADYYFLEVGNKLLEMERRGWITKQELKG
ncbi:hypothetical protein FRB96_006538 [Tulasnella sp. 330]|nr:hypothetical protein FRB96_006538 [Tulasnella sp. 330]